MLPNLRRPGPPGGLFTLNRNSPQAEGLVAFWSARASQGGNVIDMMGHSNLAITSATWDGGYALRCDAGGEMAELTAPDPIRVTIPYTWSMYFRGLGTASGGQEIFGIAHNNANQNPWASFIFNENSSNILMSYDSNGGRSQATGATLASVNGVDTVLTAMVKDGSQLAYINGVQTASTSNEVISPRFDATALAFIGNHTGISRQSQIQFYHGMIWDRELSAGEVWNLWNPATLWDLYLPVENIWPVVAAAPPAVAAHRKVDSVPLGFGKVGGVLVN